MLSDYIGRKPVLAVADIIFIAGAIGQAVSHAVWPMVTAHANRYAHDRMFNIHT